MKYTLTLGLTALFTCTAFAAFNAPLPQFKNEKQLAQWRAENASKPCKSSATEEPAFFTGKPYLESTGSYAFKYRNYNPEIARWTSEDPSGFPDGANGSAYAPVPTTSFDFMGLWRVILFNTSNANQDIPAHSGGVLNSIDGRGTLSATNTNFFASSNMLGQASGLFGSAYAFIPGTVSCTSDGKIIVSTMPIDTDQSYFTNAYVTTSITYSGDQQATVSFTWGGSISATIAGGITIPGSKIDKSFISLIYKCIE